MHLKSLFRCFLAVFNLKNTCSENMFRQLPYRKSRRCLWSSLFFIAIGLTEIHGICVNNVLKECFNLDYFETVRKSVR